MGGALGVPGALWPPLPFSLSLSLSLFFSLSLSFFLFLSRARTQAQPLLALCLVPSLQNPRLCSSLPQMGARRCSSLSGQRGERDRILLSRSSVQWDRQGRGFRLTHFPTSQGNGQTNSTVFLNSVLALRINRLAMLRHSHKIQCR